MPDCIKELDKRGIRDVVIESAKKKPFLGICLGLQLLFEKSEEGDVDGFGIFEGRIKKFQPNKQVRIKIPHMGWNKVHQSKNHPMWNNINPGSSFYFVHSFYASDVKKEYVTGTTIMARNLLVQSLKKIFLPPSFILKRALNWVYSY